MSRMKEVRRHAQAAEREHGTIQRFKQGCRCELCKEANRALFDRRDRWPRGHGHR